MEPLPADTDVDPPPFSVTETGWGEFEIQIKIFFVPEAGEKPLTVLHHLKLHPWAPPAPGEPLPPAVHSWQYDEIVFPEPLEAFYEVLMAHPPTPWPATSAQAFADPATYEAYKRGETPLVVHTPTGQVLEALSLEAQRGEADRLDLARADAVRQLDRDRERLIQTEKLLREGRARLAQLEGTTAAPGA